MKLKLEGLANGAKSGVSVVTSGLTAGGDAVSSGLEGLFSLGKGFRDFILRGTVVELAVAVVLGSAFTNLIEAVTTDFIVPLIGAIFQADELSFYIHGSKFRYGHFINAFIVFLIVIFVLYFAVVMPLQKLQYAAFKHKAIMRDCPRCLEEISMAATRCKYCCADIVIDDDMAAVIDLATAAMEAEEQRHSCLSRLFRCCVRPQQAVVRQSASGSVELEAVTVEVPPIAASEKRMSAAGGDQGSPWSSRKSSRFLSPQQSFSQCTTCSSSGAGSEEAAV